MSKLYVDNTTHGNGAIGLLIRDTEVIYTGTIINAAPAQCRNEEYPKLAKQFDVHFFFSDDNVQLDLYTVPFMEAFAADSCGGIFAKVDNEPGQIYYIDTNNTPFKVAKSFEDFVKNTAHWRECIEADLSVRAFSSREAAEQVFEIVGLDTLLPVLPQMQTGNDYQRNRAECGCCYNATSEKLK